MVPVTARTEYLTRRHRMSAVASGTVLPAGLIALVALNYVGASEFLTAAAPAVLITVGLAVAAYRRFAKPGAVVITVDGNTVHLGGEGHGIVSYPLQSLIRVSPAGPAGETTTSGRRLTVRGQKYLTLTFTTGTGTDEWRVAVVNTDPAVAEIVRRLEATLSEAGDADAAPRRRRRGSPTPGLTKPQNACGRTPPGDTPTSSVRTAPTNSTRRCCCATPRSQM